MPGLILAAVAGTLLLLLPGAALLRAGRARVVAAASAAPVCVALVGLLGIAYEMVGLEFRPFTVLPVLAVAALAGAAALASRREPYGWRSLSLLGAAALSSIACGALLLAGIGDPENISLSYDAVFHLSASAAVLETGDASSLSLYEVSNPGTAASDFYPAAWHSLVALIAASAGVGIPVATNAAVVAVAVAAWIPGVVFLTDALFPRHRRRTLLLVAAAVLASCFAAFPYLLVDWGTLYPTYLAYALLPAGLGLLVLILRGERRLLTGGLLAVWLLAEVFAHPRSLPTYAVLATPLLVTAVTVALVRMHRNEETRRRARLSAVTLVAGAVIALPLALLTLFSLFDTPGRPISDRLNGGPARANQAALDALGQAVGLGPVVSPSETAVPPSVLLAAAVLLGVVLCLRHPSLLWVVASWGALVVLYTLAASSDADAAKVLTGLWYKDKYRLMAALPVLAAPLAALGVATAANALTRLLQARAGRGSALVVTSLLLAAVASSSWSGPSLQGVVSATRTVFTAADDAATGALIDEDARKLLETVDDHVPEGRLVLGNPWRGAALTWPLGDREPVFPHLTGDWDEPRIVLAQRLDAALVDPAVCAAAEELGATYVFTSGGLLGGGGEPAAFYSGIDRAIGVPGLLTEVAREGDAALYALTACE